MARKMKDSGIQWIGEIPEDWEVTRIAGLYSLRNTKVSDRDFPPLSVTKNGILPQLETAAKSDDHNNRKLVKKGDFVINSRSDRKGSCGISKYDGSVSLINTVLEPREEMNPEYFNWVFRSSSFAEEFYKWGNGIVDDLWTTNWTRMRNINVPFPDKNQQKNIAKILNRMITDLDSVKENIEKGIQTLEEYKKSVITEAVTKGLDKNVEMKDSGIEWIGEIPKHWEVKPLKYFANINMGQSVSGADILSVQKGVPFIQGCAEFTERYPAPKYWCISPNKTAAIGSVLMSVRAPVGELNFADQDYGIGRGLCALNSNNNQYLYYLLFSNVDGLISYSNGSTYDAVTVSTIENYRVVVAPDSIQEEIVDYLDKKCSVIDESIDIKRKQLDVLDEYKKSLIYEYVTGKREV